jgi:hypothetical protein
MTPKILSAEYVREYRIRLRFEDGREAEIDLESELWGEVFEALKDREVFRAFRLDHELNTLAWPTGADLAPEFLYDCVAAQQGDAPGDGAPGGGS